MTLRIILLRTTTGEPDGYWYLYQIWLEFNGFTNQSKPIFDYLSCTFYETLARNTSS